MYMYVLNQKEEIEVYPCKPHLLTMKSTLWNSLTNNRFLFYGINTVSLPSPYPETTCTEHTIILFYFFTYSETSCTEHTIILFYFFTYSETSCTEHTIILFYFFSLYLIIHLKYFLGICLIINSIKWRRFVLQCVKSCPSVVTFYFLQCK